MVHMAEFCIPELEGRFSQEILLWKVGRYLMERFLEGSSTDAVVEGQKSRLNVDFLWNAWTSFGWRTWSLIFFPFKSTIRVPNSTPIVCGESEMTKVEKSTKTKLVKKRNENNVFQTTNVHLFSVNWCNRQDLPTPISPAPWFAEEKSIRPKISVRTFQDVNPSFSCFNVHVS